MDTSIRRRVAAATIFAGLIAAAPPAAVATTTQCGVLVCAEATAVASWECTTLDFFPGYDYIECAGTSEASAFGYGELAPGSLQWSTRTAFGSRFGDGGWTDQPGPESGPNACTWSGLGESRCGGTGGKHREAVWGLLPWGECLTSDGRDWRISATADAVASKSLPLVGPVDGAASTETAVAHISDLPTSEICAAE